MRIPAKLNFANLPTPIEELNKLTNEIRNSNPKAPKLYIKRDDYTGVEVSGNKIRKLEYALMEAKSLGRDLIITCGGVQSNHCRATAAIGAKLGIKVVLLLRGEDSSPKSGNYFLDGLFGAEIYFVNPKSYDGKLEDLFSQYEDKYRQKGYSPYTIPTGASNGIGTYGYCGFIKELIEANYQYEFDAIAVTVGSGGTYAGLLLGKHLYNYSGDIYGFNITADKDYFADRVNSILQEANEYLDQSVLIPREWIKIIDGYQGYGYALNRPEDFEFIKYMAALEGLLLDPVYTGKALKGLVEECKNGTFDGYKNLLFIHTGGVFGLMAKANEMD